MSLRLEMEPILYRVGLISPFPSLPQSFVTSVPDVRTARPLRSLLLDELYAQKLKYKAISEELDHALNDMTSM